jgi:3-oxoacyl-[acyl-carrier-protein] synthase I
MSSATPPYAVDLGIVTALGSGKRANLEGLLSARPPELSAETIGGKGFAIARAPQSRVAAAGEAGGNRVCALLREAASQIADSSAAAASRYGPRRVAVILGSTDNGSEESLEAARTRLGAGRFPEGYSLYRQSAELAPRYLAGLLGLSGPTMSLSTACASAASAVARARELIAAGICDAAVVGGSDIVSDSVALGFASLEAVSPERCLPFSRNRRGITLGEGAALFLLCRDDLGAEGLRLLGVGEASDAHHLTAPDPSGGGAAAAMSAALRDAGLSPRDIGYLNLHGTGTELNDSMEGRAVESVFGEAGVPASSTKGAVGHTLGAAGAVELGFCWLAMSSYAARGFASPRLLPPHLWDGERDEAIPRLDLAQPGREVPALSASMSVSFAFGGVDAALILGRIE